MTNILIFLILMTSACWADNKCESFTNMGVLCSKNNYESQYDGCHWKCVPNLTEKEIIDLENKIKSLQSDMSYAKTLDVIQYQTNKDIARQIEELKYMVEILTEKTK